MKHIVAIVVAQLLFNHTSFIATGISTVTNVTEAGICTSDWRTLSTEENKTTEISSITRGGRLWKTL